MICLMVVAVRVAVPSLVTLSFLFLATGLWRNRWKQWETISGSMGFFGPMVFRFLLFGFLHVIPAGPLWAYIKRWFVGNGSFIQGFSCGTFGLHHGAAKVGKWPTQILKMTENLL